MASEDLSDTIAETTRHAQAPMALDPIPLPNNSLLPLNLRLDRSNYSYWSALALAATRAYNLDGYLLGTTTQPLPTVPGTTQPNPFYAQWIRLDKFLMHWLLNSISEMLLGHVLCCRSSAEIWSVLRRFFTTSSKAKILQVKGLLQSTKKGAMSIDDYILRMRQYADVLSEADEPISDDSLCMYILAGLGQEFESTVTLLTNRTEPLNLTDLHFSLHTHELRLQQTSVPTIDQPQANVANTSSRGNGRSSGRSGRGSYRGGRSNNGGRSSGRGNHLTCQLCGRNGHTVHKCYHRFDVHFFGTLAQPDSNPNPPTDSPQSYISESSFSDDSPSSWFLDSGATNHMANNSQQHNRLQGQVQGYCWEW